MTRDQVSITLIAAGWSGAVGLVGAAAVWALRRRTIRVGFAAVALIAVLAVVAGVIGTAREMFLSTHDFQVVLIISAVAGVVALLCALLVARQVVRGSRALGDAARTIGEPGRAAFLPPSGAPAELAELSRELEETSRRLAESRERERNLESSRRELVAWVSHDLRTPLAGMRAMAEALEDNLAEDPARFHAQIRAEVERMSRMVDDLFELSRIHSGTLELTREPVLLDDILAESVSAADPLAKARGVRLEGGAEPAVTVLADPRELSRVVSNLLVNAIRHTPSGGVVSVSGRAVDSVVELVVSDECGGIPAEDLPRVFDVAFRGGTARTPEATTGAGLGLAIVRGIVEAHDGRVSVANEDPGCRFTVTLPREPSYAA